MLQSPDNTLMESRLRHKVVLLEDSLAKLYAIRKQLRENSVYVRTELIDIFSSQLETAKRRQECLMVQLDTLVGCKDDVLCKQQLQLHEALGSCKQAMECLQRVAASQKSIGGKELAAMETIENQISELLQKLSSIDLQPRESAQIWLEADSVDMRRTTAGIGRIRISSNAQHIDSLPSGHEDYEENDAGHLMYKPLQNGGSASTTVRIGYPSKLSFNPNDWLLKEALTGRTDANAGMTPEDLPAGMPLKPAGRSNSISYWLNQIKAHVEPEPMVFENVDLKSAKNQESHDPLNDLFTAYFQYVKKSPSSNWLLKHSEWSTAPFPSLTYFQEAARNMEQWLHRDNAVPAIVQSNVASSSALTKTETISTGQDNHIGVLKKRSFDQSYSICEGVKKLKIMEKEGSAAMDPKNGYSNLFPLYQKIWQDPICNWLKVAQVRSEVENARPFELPEIYKSNDISLWLKENQPNESKRNGIETELKRNEDQSELKRNGIETESKKNEGQTESKRNGIETESKISDVSNEDDDFEKIEEWLESPDSGPHRGSDSATLKMRLSMKK